MEASERETVVAYSADADTINVYTCIRKDITAMKKKDQFTLVSEGEYPDGTLYANFEIPAERFDIARAAKGTRRHTAASKQRAIEALQKYREEKARELQ